MKTAVVGEDPDGTVTYNPALVDLLGHYGAVPRACRAYATRPTAPEQAAEHRCPTVNSTTELGNVTSALLGNFQSALTGAIGPRVRDTTNVRSRRPCALQSRATARPPGTIGSPLQAVEQLHARRAVDDALADFGEPVRVRHLAEAPSEFVSDGGTELADRLLA